MLNRKYSIVALLGGLLLVHWVSAHATNAGREALREEARHWVASQVGAGIDHINIGALDSRIDTPACPQGYRFDFPFENRSTVRAVCRQPARQIYLRASIDKPQLRVVAQVALSAGQLISAADLTTRPVIGAQAGSGFDRPDLLVGRALRRSVDAGELLSAQDIEEAVPVVRTSTAQAAGAQFDLKAARVEMIPRSRAPAGAVIRLDDVKMVKLRRDIAADQVLMTDDIVDARPVVVATRNLMRGDVIDASMLALQELDRRNVPPDHLVSLAGLEQAEVMGPIRAGEPLRSSQLRPSLMVRKGQQVVLTVASGGMEISVRVEALEDARLGDQVKLRNPESGRAIAGVVTGRGSARTL